MGKGQVRIAGFVGLTNTEGIRRQQNGPPTVPTIFSYHLAWCLLLLLLTGSVVAETPQGSRGDSTEPAQSPAATRVLEAWLEQNFPSEDRAEIFAALSDLQSGNTDSLTLLTAKLQSASNLDALLDSGDPLAAPGNTIDPAAWPDEHQLPPAVLDAVTLSMAESCLHAECYEQARDWLKQLSAEPLAKSELALYINAVAHHQLLDYETAKSKAQSLLELEPSNTRRYRQIATLLLRDIEGIKPESLDSIARQMDDAQRRLRLSRADNDSLKAQDDILAALDKLIKDLEDQQKKQQQQQQASAQGSPSSSPQPLDESKASELKAPGDLHRRLIDAGGDWGALPSAERERVTQQISRDFPARYRDVIQQYFRALAEGTADNEPRRPANRGGQP